MLMERLLAGAVMLGNAWKNVLQGAHFGPTYGQKHPKQVTQNSRSRIRHQCTSPPIVSLNGRSTTDMLPLILFVQNQDCGDLSLKLICNNRQPQMYYQHSAFEFWYKILDKSLVLGESDNESWMRHPGS